MKAIGETSGAPLVWAAIGEFRREYDLRAGAEIVAVLRWEHADAIGEAAADRWRLRRITLPSQQIVITSLNTHIAAARFDVFEDWSGRLALQSGDRLHWQRTESSGRAWAFRNQDGTDLLRLRLEASTFSTRGMMQIVPGALAQPDTPLLAVLAWYLVLHSSDATGVLGTV